MSAPIGSLPPLFRLKAHYFWVFAVFGCISPYLPVYLREVKGLAPAQIGTILAVGQSGVLFLPPVMTFVADRYGLVAPLLIGLFSINVAAMAGFTVATGFAACLFAVFFNQLANQPQVALSDGLFFSLQRAAGGGSTSFSVVRVWGTIGFIVPSLAIVMVFPWGGLQVVPYAAILAALFGMANARHLPRLIERSAEARTRLPTADAARLLLRPRLALFCIGMGLLIASNAAYYGFYPLYLTQQVGIEARWVGLIATVGVTFEIGFMLGFERLKQRVGLRGLVLAGVLAGLARLGLLGFWPSPVTAVCLQFGHGLTIIGLMVAPVIYLNTLAGDSFRNSVQGLYVMLVSGVFAVSGSYLSGHFAEAGLMVLYRLAFGVCALGGALVVTSFLWPRRDRIGR